MSDVLGAPPVTYLVTGFMRSGTSMMMRALYEGLDRQVEMLVDPSRVEKLNTNAEWIPNDEYLEPPMELFTQPRFPLQHQGMLFKCMMGGVFPLWPLEGGYRVVQMWRFPEEIRASWEKCDSLPPWKEISPWLGEDRAYWHRMALNSAMLKNRKDVVSHTDLMYRDVIADPRGAFVYLAEQGWPIDVDKAAATVDPAKMRFASVA